MKFKYLYISLFILLLTSISLIIFVTIKDRDEETKRVSNSIKNFFASSLKKEQNKLLSLAIALSGDKEIKDAILSENETKAIKRLELINQKFSSYTNQNQLKFQIITNDKYIFARSWQSAFNGFPLWWFRDDLDDLSKNQRPKCAIEIGMMLTLRATAPIIDKGKVIAYIEVIKLLNDLNLELRESGLELITLMDRKFLKEASLMRENRQIDKFVVANTNSNEVYLKDLSADNFKKLIKKRSIFIKSSLYLLEDIHNSKDKKIGYFVLVAPKKTYKKIKTDLFAFFKKSLFTNDLKINSPISVDSSEGFKKYSDKELLKLIPKLRYEDRVVFLNRAREILKRYKKDELIDMILDIKDKSKKVGDIR